MKDLSLTFAKAALAVVVIFGTIAMIRNTGHDTAYHRIYFIVPTGDTISTVSYQKNAPYAVGEQDSLGVGNYGIFSLRDEPNNDHYVKIPARVIKVEKENWNGGSI